MPDWFMHNPIADLPPGLFLATFGIVIVAVIWACCTAIRGADPTSVYDLPEVPQKPDPYEIAYLRGGANEVMRTCIFKPRAKRLRGSQWEGSSSHRVRFRSGTG